MSSTNKSLPNHLIFEKILPKLPVKSLLRFKSVSKSWLSTISSPEFTKSHLQFFSSPPKLIVLAGENSVSGEEFYLLNHDENNNNYELKHFVELEFEDGCDSPVRFFNLVGSCNGLVCFHQLHVQQGSCEEAFFIGNPATRRYRKIMFPEGVFVTSVYRFVFYYESSTDDYKIFGGFSPCGGGCVQFYVFSLSAGNWSRICVLDNLVKWEELVEIVLINETVYILNESRNPVFGFNLSTEQVKDKELRPLINWVDNYGSVSLSKLGGCLLLLCTTDNYKVDDVWMLKDFSDVYSMELLFSVNHSIVKYYGFSETGKCLLHTEGKLRVFDPIRETPQMSQGGIAFDNGDWVVQSTSYVESLVSPF